MKKIIQIAARGDEMLCLTEDGKVYTRSLKNERNIGEDPSKQYPRGRVYATGTYYWKEIPIEESF